MKKNVIALAVATAMAAPLAAQAAPTVYGKAHISIDSFSSENDSYNVGTATLTEGLETDYYEVKSRASRVGVKGSEDLGGGLKAVYKMEWGVSLDENAGINSGRNAYVGLAGGFGTVLAGKHDTPMKMSTGKLDMFADEAGDYNSTVGFHDVRANNAIAYVSPNFSGVTIAAAIVPGETNSTDDNVANDADGLTDATSVAVMYSGGPLYASAAVENISQDYLNAGSTTEYFADDFVKTRVGVGYGMGALKVGLVYEQQDFGDVDRNLMQLSGGYTMGANTIKAMYGMAEDLGDMDDSGRTTMAIGLDHAFSKSTKGYIQYATIEGDDNDVGTVGGVMNYVMAVTDGTGSVDVNTDTTVTSIGMVTKF